MRIDDKGVREFYMNEAIEGNWNTRQLEREINTFSYQGYLASHSNHDVVDDATKREKSDNPKDIIKNPYVLDFLENYL